MPHGTRWHYFMTYFFGYILPVTTFLLLFQLRLETNFRGFKRTTGMSIRVLQVPAIQVRDLPPFPAFQLCCSCGHSFFMLVANWPRNSAASAKMQFIAAKMAQVNPAEKNHLPLEESKLAKKATCDDGKCPFAP